MRTSIFLIGTFILLTLTPNSLFAQIPDYVPTSGLIGWYPFNGNTNDESGNGNHGIDYGLKLDTDRYGNLNSAYYFDSLSKMTIDTIQSLNQIDTALTISLWIKSGYNPSSFNSLFDPSCFPVSAPCYRLIYWLGNSIVATPPSHSLSIVTTNSFIYAYGYNGNLVNNNSDWQNIVNVYDGDSASIFVDGILVDKVVYNFSTPGYSLPEGLPVNFGNNTESFLSNPYCYNPSAFYGFFGLMDDIALWNRALSSSEVSQLYISSCNKPDFVSLGTERTTALCPNDSVKIFVVNPQGPGLTYQWFKSDAVIPGAVDSFYYANEVRKYKVRVSNGPNCFRTSGRIQPTVAIPPSVSITPQGSTDICAGDSVLLVANYNPGYSYQWRRYGVDIPGATDTMYYASQPGNYKIFITNDGGCISKSSNVSVNIVCRLAGSAINSDVEVMPNPTSDNFSVKLNDLGDEVPVSVEFIDQQGRLIESRRVNGQTLIDFTAMGLSNGNYTVIVRFESGETVEKVVSVVR